MSFSGVPQWWRVVSVIRIFVGQNFLSLSLSLFLSLLFFALAGSYLFISSSFSSRIFPFFTLALVSHIYFYDVIIHYEYGIILLRLNIRKSSHYVKIFPFMFSVFPFFLFLGLNIFSYISIFAIILMDFLFCIFISHYLYFPRHTTEFSSHSPFFLSSTQQFD